MRQFLTPDTVSELLSVPVGQVYDLLESGELLGIRVGPRGLWRVEQSHLDLYIDHAYAFEQKAARWNEANLANIPEVADGRII